MKTNGSKILIVDDDSLVRKSLYESLRREGFIAGMACDGEEAIRKIEESGFNIVIADYKMPKMDGIELLKRIKSKFPYIEVIIVTGFGNIETAVEAMKIGAYDYITKPVNDSELKMTLSKIIERNSLIRENVSLRKKLDSSVRDNFHRMIGRDPKMQKIYTMIEAIAESSATVLITGDSGTGKRLVAQAIHASDKFRKDRAFVELSCGALPETLLESELFGHVKGAFTGAIKDRKGRFELADGGTIFLDEIDAFSPALQVKLLRVLQEGEFERVGDTETLKVNIRVIAATNQNLEDLIKQRAFREDLYYRLHVISINLPTLKERNGDIKLLTEHFIKKYNAENPHKIIKGITNEALEIFIGYDWPGNIRELENAIERAMVLTPTETIDKDILPEALHRNYAMQNGLHKGNTLKGILEEPEKNIILNALDETRGNKKAAAEKLGINRTTLYNKLKKHGVRPGNRK